MTVKNQGRGYPGDCTVSWLDAASTAHEELASANLLERELYLAQRIREGNRYPQQRNYHGFYFFSQTRRLVWHESLLEASMLRWLDHTADIVAVATQPMKLVFSNGASHFPDAIAMRATGEQLLIDVKASRYVKDAAVEQFARTSAVCERVGWEYLLFTGLPAATERNLKFLGLFKHPAFRPGAAATHVLISALRVSRMPFGEAARLLAPDALPQGRSHLLHLLWTREVSCDITQRLTDTTLITEAPNA
ncbi:hypothetical protein SAMN04489806_1641 [Paramicrobacterium humi]|uniref:TnsA endonuclease N terminal n=2 Tax=Paramicrobacterium humi TaxID=640635 RepID=A0A1H4LSD6_9MICO|nr:hypothetical protein SAMN04489806_1641 [Microbacterium humi]